MSVTSDAPASHYETIWDDYSRRWDEDPHFRRYRHLGDEWGPDEWVSGVIEGFAKPYLRPESVALEIGPGGGRYTMRLAPLCAEIFGVDVSNEMLSRAERRLAHHGHVHFAKGNGRDLGAIPDASVNFVFSFNVFVQLALEDVHGYLEEIARVLTPNGVAALHYATLSTDEGFAYFRQHRESWSKDPLQRGRFGPLTLDAMAFLAASVGLGVLRNEPIGRDAMVVLQKPAR